MAQRGDGPAVGPRQLVLTLSCPDRPGIVHAVAAYLYGSDSNILDSQQFADLTMNRFFMRVHVETLGDA
ncbi:MAG TPA: ACT domain-containing protein, partial [Streptosporangiaceae bacterium]|nr:ACT domain-containing protein [Streptosporangiaceae bacterium]